MKIKSLGIFLATVATSTWLLPVASLSAAPPAIPAAPPTLDAASPTATNGTGTAVDESLPNPAQFRLSRDAQLDEKGVLHGQLIDLTGQPVAGTDIRIQHRNRVLDSATTDARGQFNLRVQRTGAYIITVDGAAIACRCWDEGLAPPACSQDFVLLAPGNTVRGQRPFGEIITNPLFIGAVIAAAVAIPIAVANSDGS